MRLIAFGLLLTLVSCMPKDLPTVSNISDHLIEVKMSHMTTQTEMDKIINDLKPHNITMDYSGSRFFDDGKLRDLKLRVYAESGAPSGQCAPTLTKLQYSYYGFILKSDGYFFMGSLE